MRLVLLCALGLLALSGCAPKETASEQKILVHTTGTPPPEIMKMVREQAMQRERAQRPNPSTQTNR